MIIKYSKCIYARDPEHIIYSNSGSPEVPEYKLIYPTTGGVALERCGTIPLYEQIQANKVNCDLSSVLEQCVHQNQLAVRNFDEMNQAITDFTGFSNMAEWYSGMKHLEQIWSETPIDVREQFNSSKANFINSIGTDDFTNKVNQGYKKYYDSLKKRLDPVSLTVESKDINSESEV